VEQCNQTSKQTRITSNVLADSNAIRARKGAKAMATSPISIPSSRETDNPTPTGTQPSTQTGTQTAKPRRPLIYVASPKAVYQTPRYDQMLLHARRHFPNADLLPARDLYLDNQHWRATWPKHLKRISAVVFFADADATLGRGVVTELSDARRQGVPIYYLQDDGSLLPYKQVAVEVLDGGASWQRYARVRVKSGDTAQEKPTENTRKGGRHVAS
jgi:hypothetical protein